jgi:hypothetical protein
MAGSCSLTLRLIHPVYGAAGYFTVNCTQRREFEVDVPYVLDHVRRR